MTTGPLVPESLQGTTGSTLAVYQTLRLSETSLSTSELADELGKSEPTIRRALATLRTHDVLTEVAHCDDLRTPKYDIR